MTYPGHGLLFTRGLAHVYTALLDIRAGMYPGEFRLHASYHREPTPLHLSADAVHREPNNGDEANYLDWLLALCAAENIHSVWPQNHLRTLYQHREKLEAADVHLLLPAASLEDYEDLDDKARFMNRLQQQVPPMPLPAWRTVCTPAELKKALAALANECPEAQFCFKPAKGTYGQGFRIIDEAATPWRRLLTNDSRRLQSQELETALAENYEGRTFLLMEYLPGTERSLDCLVERGELRTCVVRRKSEGRWQWVENHPESLTIARALCGLFGLNGVVNIQIRERLTPQGPRSCILEVNPRMAGGMGVGRAVGCNLALWGARLAAGVDLREVPLHTTDVWAGQMEQALCLGSGKGN